MLGKTNTCYDKCERIVQTKCPTNDNCNVKVAYSYSNEVCVKEKVGGVPQDKSIFGIYQMIKVSSPINQNYSCDVLHTFYFQKKKIFDRVLDISIFGSCDCVRVTACDSY